MKNLAGHPERDYTIALELEQAEIELVHLDQPSGEVNSGLSGRLGPITFTRAWMYWVAEGPIPLVVARDLYADPVGRWNVRVDGHGSGPPPEAPSVRWYTGEGARVCPTEQRTEILHLREKWPEVFEKMPPIVFHDDPVVIGAQGYIDLYHIDTSAGLAVFTSTLRKHRIDQLLRPVWWAWHHPPTSGDHAASGAAVTARAAPSQAARPWEEDTQEMDLSDEPAGQLHGSGSAARRAELHGQ